MEILGYIALGIITSVTLYLLYVVYRIIKTL